MNPHDFHIPVMGTGFTLDTPLRVARFGISSVMSLADDALVERVRRHHCRRLGLTYEPIPARSPDARAKRITAWCDLVHDVVARQMAELRALPVGGDNDKTKYIELLPDESPAKRAHAAVASMPEGEARAQAETALAGMLVPGSADVNIMTKLDRARFDRAGLPLGPEFSDAKAALRGFAESRLESNLVLSAGMNPTLFGLLERFPAFYRDSAGCVRKGIVLKVSDYRSALVQGKFLAKKGIEVLEFRLESGLNCGGHAFATEGHLLGPILEEFRDRRAELEQTFEPMVRHYYTSKGMPLVGGARRIRVTVQGGIGNNGEVRRLREHYGVDGTGWATPFLLVPEATALDAPTRRLLAEAREEDLYVSDVSPLGVPFNNVRGTSSELETARRIEAGRPGSSCPNGYLASNTEFSALPLCTASREYQAAKLGAMGLGASPPRDPADPRLRGVYSKTCICSHLGNGALVELGIARPDAPVAVCPGPNIAYFGRQYTLREMVDHIYGRRPSLVPQSRPHMLAKELEMYVDYFERRVTEVKPGDARAIAQLAAFKDNMERGLAHCGALAQRQPFDGENMESLQRAAQVQGRRLKAAWDRFHRRAPDPAGDAGVGCHT